MIHDRWERIFAQGMLDAEIDPSADVTEPAPLAGYRLAVVRLRHWYVWRVRRPVREVAYTLLPALRQRWHRTIDRRWRKRYARAYRQSLLRIVAGKRA